MTNITHFKSQFRKRIFKPGKFVKSCSQNKLIFYHSKNKKLHQKDLTKTKILLTWIAFFLKDFVWLYSKQLTFPTKADETRFLR
jgi:hypothetical protein